jgi:small redox-active disulfide protein 2
MISIKVLGPGCANCVKVADLVREAVLQVGAEAEIVKVTHLPDILKYRLLATPGLVINERVVCAGRIPTAAEVTTWVTNALAVEG